MQHRRTRRPWIVFLAALALSVAAMGACPRPALAGPDDPVVPKELQKVGLVPHLDGQVPLDTPFRDHTGKPVLLRDSFDGKRPVLLTFAYHSCPVLCGMILNSVVEAMSNVGWTAGKEYDVVTISIDPRDTLEHTTHKRMGLLAQYKRPEGEKGWQFLLGEEANIKRVTDSVGYNYDYDAESQQFAHPATIVILKPDGKVSRYLNGIEFSPKDLKIALLEAADYRSTSFTEKAILYCYRYDPHEGKYVVMATNIMRAGGALTALLLGSFLGVLWRRERKKAKALAAEAKNQVMSHDDSRAAV